MREGRRKKEFVQTVTVTPEGAEITQPQDIVGAAIEAAKAKSDLKKIKAILLEKKK